MSAELPMDATASTEPASIGWPPALQRHLLPYVRDPLLWPVTFSVLAHGSVVLAPLFLHIVRGFAPASLAVTALLGAATFKVSSLEWRALRRPGAVTVLLALTWLGGVAVAWLADRHGLY